jgi:Tfp pilus assembly protein PilE
VLREGGHSRPRTGPSRPTTVVHAFCAAAIAIPKFANTKEKAYVASMKSDLRNLVTAQEAYFSDYYSVYAASTTTLGTNYKPSTGVKVTIFGTSGTGWSATATSVSTSKVCNIALGSGATTEGDPICH